MKLFLSIFLLVCSISREKNVAWGHENIGNRNTRIIGGQPATIVQFPFAAAIDVNTTDSSFFCGGALYGRQYVITAGQCVDGAIMFMVRLGSASLVGSDPILIGLATSDYFLHPDYNRETLENDIGIIRLRIPIAYTNYIESIAYLGMEELSAKADLRAIGWGQTSDASSALSERLNVVNVASLSNNECRITFGNQIKDSMVCVAGNYNGGSCHGDTGSPLIDAYDEYSAIHVGIASFISGNGCESTDPSGYTRTYPYLSWIKNITGK